jgi:hypothetical protein
MPLRRFTVVLLALLGSGCEPRYVDGLARSRCEATEGGLPARRAAEFLDSLGMGVHPQWTDTIYGDFPRLVSQLARLRVRHVRDDAIGADGSGRPHFQALAREGIKIFLALNVRTDLAALSRDLGPALEAVQVPTPLDAAAGRPPVDETAANAAALARAVAALPADRRPTIVGPILGPQVGADAVGDLSPFVDFGAVTYGQRPPGGAALDRKIADVRVAFGERPLVAPHGGGYPLVAGSSETPVTEAVQAKYVLRLYLETFRRGVRRTYYTRLNDAHDPQGYGLVTAQGEPKPSFLALEALAALLDAPGGEDLPAGGLPVTIRDGQPELHTLLLRKGDGRFVLLLWLEVASGAADVTRAVTIDVGVPLRAASLVELRTAGSAPQALPTAGALPVVVSDHPTAIVLDPACR